MKAILEFDFNGDNFDRSEFEDAVNGSKWKMAMWELDQELRARSKYASDNDDPKVVEAYYKLRDDIREIMHNHSLTFND